MGKRVNTTKKERLELLKRLGYTEEEMKAFWDEAAKVNFKIAALQKNGYKWTDLCVFQMEQLPGLAEKTRQQLEEKKLREQKEKEEKERIRNEKIYYAEHFEEIMYSKIVKGLSLTEEELSDIVSEYETDRVWSADDIGRWQIPVLSIVKLKGTMFGINWYKGLTESQCDSFNEQPYRVESKKKKVEITVWEKMK